MKVLGREEVYWDVGSERKKTHTGSTQPKQNQTTKPRGPSNSAFSSGYFSSLEPAQDK